MNEPQEQPWPPSSIAGRFAYGQALIIVGVAMLLVWAFFGPHFLGDAGELLMAELGGPSWIRYVPYHLGFLAGTVVIAVGLWTVIKASGADQ